MNYHSQKILESNNLKTLLDAAYCWEHHKKGDSSNLKTILYVLTGHLGSWSGEVKYLMRKYLNERGLKGVHRFTMPEMVTWCGCEPYLTEFRKLQREFIGDPDILC